LEDALCIYCEQKQEEEQIVSPLHTGTVGDEPSSCHLTTDDSKSQTFSSCVGKWKDLVLQEQPLDGNPQKSIGGARSG